MPISVECSQCHKRYRVPDEAAGRTGKCPGCGAAIQVPGASIPVPAAPEPAPPAAQDASLPRKMVANRAVAGRTCTVCGRTIGLGEPVENCELCRQSTHESCWQAHGGCGTPSCGNAPLPKVETAPPPAAAAPAAAPADVAGPPMKPCPFCGEQIYASATKCRHCGEYLSGGLRPGMRRPTGTSGKAIAALVCGIISIFLSCWGIILAIVAIALGASARNDIAASRGTLGGSGMATAGIVLGIVGLLLSILWIVIIVSVQNSF